jgi:hypothetical protein
MLLTPRVSDFVTNIASDQQHPAYGLYYSYSQLLTSLLKLSAYTFTPPRPSKQTQMVDVELSHKDWTGTR